MAGMTDYTVFFHFLLSPLHTLAPSTKSRFPSTSSRILHLPHFHFHSLQKSIKSPHSLLDKPSLSSSSTVHYQSLSFTSTLNSTFYKPNPTFPFLPKPQQTSSWLVSQAAAPAPSKRSQVEAHAPFRRCPVEVLVPFKRSLVAVPAPFNESPAGDLAPFNVCPGVGAALFNKCLGACVETFLVDAWNDDI
jgi:hypothetical protein